MTDPHQPEDVHRSTPPPAGGYTVPGPAMIPPPSHGPDPLAGAPDDGFEGWVRRTVDVCKRSFGPALALIAGTYLVPAVLIAALSSMIMVRASHLNAAQPDPDDPLRPLREIAHSLAPWYALLILVTVAASYLRAVGWSAAVRVMTHDAAGAPRDLGAALRFGMRRGVPMWGWLILEGLCVLVGVCACILPGIYLLLAMSLIVPVVVFERGQPAITRSFRLVHSSFWPTVGRLLLLGVCVLVYEVIVSAVVGAIAGTGGGLSAALQTTPGGPQHFGTAMAAQLVAALFMLPVMVVGLAGLLSAYAELRSREGESVTTTGLAAAST